MQEQTEYEVWKLVENQGRCYASTDCVGGVTLRNCVKGLGEQRSFFFAG